MILGELPKFQQIVKTGTKPATKQKLITTRVELNQLKVVRCFHVSPVKNRESILRYGLLPKGKLPTSSDSKISYEPRIFVSVVTDEVAYDYAGFDDVDVWAFFIKKDFLNPDEFSNYANHYYLKQRVPWWKVKLSY